MVDKIDGSKVKVFFTSDTHFCHTNIISFCNRPYESADEMNEGLISNWNSVVGKEDHIYHLGDVGMGGPAEKIITCVQRLNGKKFLIEGNHDNKLTKNEDFRKEWEWIKSYYEFIYREHDTGTKQLVVMSHYPFRSWNGSHRGSFALSGHTHNSLPESRPDFIGAGKLLDVGVDVHEFKPIAYSAMKSMMANK